MKTKIILLFTIIACSANMALAQIIYEAEDATFSAGKVDTKHPGFTGDGFVDTENNAGEWIEWSVNSFKQVTSTIGFKYALGKNELRDMQVYLNSKLIDTINFDSAGEFTDYVYKYSNGVINEGLNTIKIVAINEFGAPNLDHMTLETDIDKYLKLDLQVGGEGTISPDPAQDSILYGTRVKLTAEPNPGSTFINWTGDKSGTQNPIAFTVDNNYSLTAHFLKSLKAFPGAGGFGANATGGRGGEVIEVTNLNDTGEGSLRAACTKSGARTVVFRVSGTITLHSTLQITNPNITIAGQTAPGEGITLAGYTFKIGANNVIIRYIRTRLGDVQGVEDDAMNCRRYKNIIIDHCTMSWSVDEVASFYDNQKMTVQYCMMSEALYNSIHEKGNHSYGGIWGGQSVSFHHNLFAHNTSRNPRFCGSRYTNRADLELVDFRNNVLFNWGFNSIYGAEGGNYNLINNYYKPGPATSSGTKTRIIAPNVQGSGNQQPEGVWGMFYVDGNYMTASEGVTTNNWAGVHAKIADINDIKSTTPFECDTVITQSAQMAYEHVLATVGCNLPARDVIDNRIIDEVISGTTTFGTTYGEGKGIIDSQTEVGGWPELESTTPPDDSDHDGMPDAWETANNLNPNDDTDRNGDIDSDGYTNLEEYLNSLIEEQTYLIRPMNFIVESFSKNVINLAWTKSDNSTSGYLLERAKDGGDYEEIEQLSSSTNTYTDVVSETGRYYYRLQAYNSVDTSFYTESVEILVSALSADQTGLSENVKVYPNPFNNSVSVNINNSDNKVYKIKVTDLLGKNVITKNVVNSGLTTISTSHLNTGVYLLLITSDNQAYTQKIIKQ